MDPTSAGGLSAMPEELENSASAHGPESAALASLRYLNASSGGLPDRTTPIKQHPRQPKPKNPFLDADDLEDDGNDDTPVQSQHLHQQLAQRQISKQSSTSPTEKLSVHKFAEYLLSNRFYLTALEYHAELCERGESQVPRLANFFSNPGNFESTYGPAEVTSSGAQRMQRSPSVTTFDSFDAARNSDNGDQGTDERVAVLEFELRKARETIAGLRQELTDHARSMMQTHRLSEEDAGAEDDQDSQARPGDASADEPIQSHERRVMNYLIYEYLLQLNYKYTPTTFAEENPDQIFDSWDDVGLNIPKPKDLLRMLRSVQDPAEAAKAGCSPSALIDAGCQADLEDDPRRVQWERERAELRERTEELEELVDQLKAESAASKQRVLKLENDLHRAKSSMISSRSKQRSDGIAAGIDGGGGGGGPKEVDDLIDDEEPSFTATSRSVPQAFTRQLYQSVLPFRLEESLVTVGTSPEELVRILGHVLPCLIPGVLFDYRHLAVPLAVHAACLHPDSGARDQLLRLLFNMTKTPDRKQRNEILEGCLSFAKTVGPSRLEAELLPQIWEQLGHKADSRRLLVVEACATLLPFLPATLRDSLVLSMLQQMFSEERTPEVRCAIIRTFALLACYIEDRDKFPGILRILMASLVASPTEHGSSESVTEATMTYLLPAVAGWALELGCLHTSLLDQLLEKIEASLKLLPSVAESLQLSRLLQLLQMLVPFVVVWIVRHLPQSSGYASRQQQQHNQQKLLLQERTEPDGCCSNGELSGAKGSASAASPSARPNLYAYELICPSFALYSQALHCYCSQPAWESWTEASYIDAKLAPALLAVLQCQHIGEAHCSVVCQLFGQLSASLGMYFVQRTLVPLMRRQLYDLTTSQLRLDSLETCLLAGYCVCLLASCSDDESDTYEAELRDEVHKVLLDGIVALANQRRRLNGVCACLKELCSLGGSWGEKATLQVLWDCMVLPEATQDLRIACCRLCNALVHSTEKESMLADTLKALVTLSSDPNPAVRRACLKPLGSVLTLAKSAELLDKARVQTSEILFDPGDDVEARIECANFCTAFGPKVDQRFREDILLPVMERLTGSASEPKLLLSLFEAYSALSCSYLSASAAETKLLPGLKLLADRLTGQPDHRTVVDAIVQDLEAKISVGRSATSAGTTDGSGVVSAASATPETAASGTAVSGDPASGKSSGSSLVERLKDLRDGKHSTRSLFSRKK